MLKGKKGRKWLRANGRREETRLNYAGLLAVGGKLTHYPAPLTMSLPIKLISTDFDGTLFAEFESPPIPEEFERLIGELQAQGVKCCLLYTSDAADERSSVDL